MKLNEIKEGYFKKLCQDIFIYELNQDLLKDNFNVYVVAALRDIKGLMIDKYKKDCEWNEMRMIFHASKEIRIDNEHVLNMKGPNFEKFAKFMRKSKIRPSKDDFGRGRHVWEYTQDGITFYAFSESVYSGYVIHEDELK